MTRRIVRSRSFLAPFLDRDAYRGAAKEKYPSPTGSRPISQPGTRNPSWLPFFPSLSRRSLRRDCTRARARTPLYNLEVATIIKYPDSRRSQAWKIGIVNWIHRSFVRSLARSPAPLLLPYRRITTGLTPFDRHEYTYESIQASRRTRGHKVLLPFWRLLFTKTGRVRKAPEAIVC